MAFFYEGGMKCSLAVDTREGSDKCLAVNNTWETNGWVLKWWHSFRVNVEQRRRATTTTITTQSGFLPQTRRVNRYPLAYPEPLLVELG